MACARDAHPLDTDFGNLEESPQWKRLLVDFQSLVSTGRLYGNEEGEMTVQTRQEVLAVLEGDWASYVRRFRSLSPDEQSAFLAKQGYARIGDLLAHVVAWWQMGYRAIESYIADPQFQAADCDVDSFNAEAVARASGLDDEALIASFEKMRSFLCDFVKALPEAAFENEKVVKQFNMEIVGHLSEHNLPEKE